MKRIKNYPNYYIDKRGNVYRKLKPKNLGNYPSISLYKNSKLINKTIHRLVLETYVGECPKGMECRHLDGNKSNNNLSNLCWGTRSENIKDRYRHGYKIKGIKGELSAKAKLTNKQVIEIRKLYSVKRYNQKQLAKRYNVCQVCISDIILNKTWKHI